MISMLQQLEKQFETLRIVESLPAVDASPSDIQILPNECVNIIYFSQIKANCQQISDSSFFFNINLTQILAELMNLLN